MKTKIIKSKFVEATNGVMTPSTKRVGIGAKDINWRLADDICEADDAYAGDYINGVLCNYAEFSQSIDDHREEEAVAQLDGQICVFYQRQITMVILRAMMRAGYKVYTPASSVNKK